MTRKEIKNIAKRLKIELRVVEIDIIVMILEGGSQISISEELKVPLHFVSKTAALAMDIQKEFLRIPPPPVEVAKKREHKILMELILSQAAYRKKRTRIRLFELNTMENYHDLTVGDVII